MALATTTLSAAVAINDNVITVAAATSLAAGRLIRVDDEWMEVSKGYVIASLTVPVLRGQQGSAVLAHTTGANVTHGLGTDFSVPPAGVSLAVTQPATRARKIMSYNASGAITLPQAGEDMIAVIQGTSALTMTIAAPTKDLDGCIVWITGNAKSASTVQFNGTVGIGNAGASYDIITFQNAGNVGVMVMAVNGFWNIFAAPAITGTTTAIGVAVA